MNCKFCGAELVEGKPFCPECGKSQEPEVEMETMASEDIIEEAAPEILEPKKGSAGKIALAIVAVVVVIALLAAMVLSGMKPDLFGGEKETLEPTDVVEETVAEETVAPTVPADGNPDDVTCKGTYTVTDDEAAAAADTVVATMGGRELTNGQLQVYYWEEVYAFLQEYGDYATYFGLDYTKPLDTQLCESEEVSVSWQQYFLECALNTWRSYLSMALEGEENDFELDADTKAYLESLPADLTNMATEDGYGSVDEMIKNFVGAGPSLEDYIEYIETYHEGYVYFNHVYDSTLPTPEEVEAYFLENEASYAENGITRDGVYVDIRHILIQPEDSGQTDESGYPVYTEEAWAAAKAEADKIYGEWRGGNHTEDRFAQLAMQYSVDGSASNGGLYTDVYEGQMVENFNDWCFDETRKVGDFDLIQTQFGYHIMYFSGSTEIWYSNAEYDLISQTVSAVIPAAMEKYPAEIDYSAIKLAALSLG